ncbi:hypothetical protein NPIL_1931 [Nephila pilipes]|uniref:Uncharacterized protein n=1 Tax=Nephila pilipes TaxID=299642 RepID=A0A8X6PUI3_NEPPI|nr:hypothetical protein NPIL_1931 [Nephila pilipes]
MLKAVDQLRISERRTRKYPGYFILPLAQATSDRYFHSARVSRVTVYRRHRKKKATFGCDSLLERVAFSNTSQNLCSVYTGGVLGPFSKDRYTGRGNKVLVWGNL